MNGLRDGARRQGRAAHAGLGADPLDAAGEDGSCPTSRTGPRVRSCRRRRRRRRCRSPAARRRAPARRRRPRPRGARDGAASTRAPSPPVRTLVGQIPLSPPLNTRLIALVVVEIVLAVIVVLLYFKYKELKSVPLDEWWARRLEEATPRMRRMIRESQEIYEEEQAALERSRLRRRPGRVRPGTPRRRQCSSRRAQLRRARRRTASAHSALRRAREGERPDYVTACAPASTCRISPVTARERSLSRKTAASATSSAVTLRRKRRVLLHHVEHRAEVLDAARRHGVDRARRDGVHADAHPPQVGGQVAHARLERGLGRSHHVVVGDHPPGALVGHRHDGPAAAHQPVRLASHGDETVGADVVGLGESQTSRLHEVALQVFGGRVGDAVHDAVEHGHRLGELLDRLADRLVRAHVALDEGHVGELLRQLREAALEPLGLVGERHPAAFTVDRLGHRPGDAALVGDAHDQHIAPVEQSHSVTPFAT